MQDNPPPPAPGNPDAIPPLLAAAQPRSTHDSLRTALAAAFSLCIGMFLLDAIVSVLDDLLIVTGDIHVFSVVRAILGVVTILMALGVYALVGLTPMVPKRLALPIPISLLAILLGSLPLAIYCYHQLPQAGLCLSLFQLAVGVWLFFVCRCGSKFNWMLVPVTRIGTRLFSWGNLLVFVLVNVFLLPAIAVYVVVWIAVGVSHLSDGFVALHPRGFSVQVRKYVRADGKIVELFPMTHVANSAFYENISKAFPTNSLILLEGVTDEKNLLTNKITYKRMAKSLGLAEQHEAFEPQNGEPLPADIDVAQFSTNTLSVLNLVMFVHAHGITPETISALANYSAPPGLDREVLDDILTKRNQHLAEQIQKHLSETDNIMVPWGAAHMPGVAREIEKAGFHVAETRDYDVITFGRKGK